MKKVFLVLLVFFCLSVAHGQNSQNQQQIITEKNLIKSWQLKSDMLTDDVIFYPTEVLLLQFFPDHTCKGAIADADTTLSGSWTLDNKQLVINYHDRNGMTATEEYTIDEFTPNKMRIIHSAGFGSAIRVFTAK